MVGAAGREWRLVKLRRGMRSRVMWTFFLSRRGAKEVQAEREHIEIECRVGQTVTSEQNREAGTGC